MITINIYYRGNKAAAADFAEEMERTGIADAIRNTEGNLRYEYFRPFHDPETILLVDSWRDQQALDAHHASEMMEKIAALRQKYHLHMEVERYVQEGVSQHDQSFIV